MSSSHTEATMLGLLEARYRQTSGNGPAWAFIPHVRNAAGHYATRTIDAIAMSLWPSRGLEIHGHEIKVSRSDWLRELKDPAKAEAFTRHCDRWWLVVSDAKVVAAGELPPTWGLMVAHGRGLRVLVEAPQLPLTDSEWMPRTFLAALLRASCRTAQTTPAEIEAAVATARTEWDSTHAERIEGWRASRDGLRAKIRAFEAATGLALGIWTDDGQVEQAAKIGAAVRLVLDGEAQLERFERRFSALAVQAETLAVEIRRALSESE